MLPFRISLGPFAITPNELTILLGAVLAAIVVRKRMAELAVRATDLFDIALAGLIGGAVGARLFYFVPLWIRGKETADRLLSSWSDGSAFYGGIIGGILAVMIVTRIKKLPVLKVADACFSVVPIGFAVGKLGCFLAGCCYGKETQGILGFHFPRGSLAFETQVRNHRLPAAATSSLPVHATQFYELAFSLALFILLRFIGRRSRRPGEVALAWFMIYSAWRFGIEFLRDDPYRNNFGSAFLSDSQIAALIVGTVALLAWIWMRLKRAAEPEQNAGMKIDPARS